jgi:hypothetical protein
MKAKKRGFSRLLCVACHHARSPLAKTLDRNSVKALKKVLQMRNDFRRNSSTFRQFRLPNLRNYRAKDKTMIFQERGFAEVRIVKLFS